MSKRSIQVQETRYCGIDVSAKIFTDDGPGLQEDDPILCRDVVGMDRNIVTGDVSIEDTHFSVILSVSTCCPRIWLDRFFTTSNSMRQDTADLPGECIQSLIIHS